MEFESRIITYGELRKGFHFENDKYGIASYEYEARRKAFLANPNIGDDDDSYMYLKLADGIPVGRSIQFDTRLKVGDKIVPLYSGSALEVVESYRQYGIGGEIFAYSRRIKKRNILISAGISDSALPLYKVMKYTFFVLTRMLQLRDAKPLLGKKGITGITQKVLGAIVNGFLKCMGVLSSFKTRSLRQKFELRLVSVVPEWVDELTLNDGRKYCEVHDHKWLQWNLDHSFKSESKNKQSFYIIVRESKPMGFVMTKERFRANIQGMKNVTIGSIVEWGSMDENELCEADIYRLTLETFSSDVDIVEIATNDTRTLKSVKRLGFIQHGEARIAIKDKTKQLTDIADITKWRLRYGYADVILN